MSFHEVNQQKKKTGEDKKVETLWKKPIAGLRNCCRLDFGIINEEKKLVDAPKICRARVFANSSVLIFLICVQEFPVCVFM